MSAKSISMVATILSGIWLTPYLIRYLGISAYGMIPLAAVLTQYSSTITQGISASINRFFTMELHKSNGNPNQTFNTSFFLYIAISCVQIPIFILVINYSNTLIKIPEGLFYDAMILLACSASAYLLSLVGGVFSTSAYANNRIDVIENIVAGKKVLRLIAIVILFTILGPKLRYIGYVDILLAIIVFITQIAFWKKLTPDLFVSFQAASLKIIIPMFGLSLWIIVNKMGIIFHSRTSIWLANRFISPTAGGEFAAISQWVGILSVVSGGLSVLVGPMVMAYVGRKESDLAVRLSTISLKMLSLALAVPVSIIIIYSKNILEFWLGIEYGKLWLVMVLIASPLFFVITPLHQLNAAKLKIRFPAILTLVMGAIHVALSVLFIKYVGNGLIGLGVSTAVTLIIKNVILMPLYTAHVEKTSVWVFISPTICGLPIFGVAWLGSYFINKIHVCISIYDLLLNISVLSILTVPIIWFFFLNRSEKTMLTEMLIHKKRNLQ